MLIASYPKPKVLSKIIFLNCYHNHLTVTYQGSTWAVVLQRLKFLLNITWAVYMLVAYFDVKFLLQSVTYKNYHQQWSVLWFAILFLWIEWISLRCQKLLALDIEIDRWNNLFFFIYQRNKIREKNYQGRKKMKIISSESAKRKFRILHRRKCSQPSLGWLATQTRRTYTVYDIPLVRYLSHLHIIWYPSI